MDRLAIEAAEAFVHAGYPLDAEALLIVELDGCEAEVDHLIAAVEAIAARHGATSCRASQSEEERLLFWAGRKAAFPAVGRISPDYYCMDGTIPRKRIGDVLLRMKQMEARYGLRAANVFHAGDGNLHPLILYDANKPGELERAEAFGSDILRLCVEVGGVLTGEHGVGVEKRDLMDTMFNEIDLNQQQRLKCAFDRKEPAQSRQSVPAALPLRGTRPRACPRRTAPLPRSAALLNQRSFMTVFQPSDAAEAAEVVAWAAAEGQSLEIVAGGSKRGLGRPPRADHRLDVSRLAGIVDYDPAELILTARAATPMAEIEAELEAKRQMLAFEPPDWRSLIGGDRRANRPLAAFSPAISPGPRRVRAGAARDYFLGFSAINGWGEHLEGWRQGGEERHRLRHVQAASRRLWHSVGAYRSDSESHAEAGDGLHHPASVDGGRNRHSRTVASPEHALRGVGGCASAGAGGAPLGRRGGGRGPRRRNRAPPRRPGSLRRLPRQGDRVALRTRAPPGRG